MSPKGITYIIAKICEKAIQKEKDEVFLGFFLMKEEWQLSSKGKSCMNNIHKYLMTVKNMETVIGCKVIIACLDISTSFENVHHGIQIDAGIRRIWNGEGELNEQTYGSYCLEPADKCSSDLNHFDQQRLHFNT